MLDIPTARELLSRTRPVPNRAGYPASVRSEVIALVQHLRAQGRTTHSISGELGLHGSTVRSWLESAAVDGPAFVAVELAEPEPAPETVAAPGPPPAPPRRPPSGLTLISPRGFRLEGLDLDSAITALLRLS